MAKTGTRVATFIMAAVFLASTLAVSVGVIFLIRQENKQKDLEQKAIAEYQKSLEKTTSPEASQVETTKKAGENMLQGTQLEGFTPTTEGASKVATQDLKVGDGQEVTASNEVTVHYTGAVASTGTIFQSSKDSGQPFVTTLDKVIKGWKDGIIGMKVGGTRRITIPAAEAYGANPPQGSGIPANADLIFDIDLISVK